MQRVLDRSAPFAVKCKTEETEDQARKRILDTMFAAMGVAAIAPAGL